MPSKSPVVDIDTSSGNHSAMSLKCHKAPKIWRRSSHTSPTNFWKAPSSSEDHFWSAYEATRPNYASSNFLETIYDYHDEKDASFSIAHDVGCGSGVGAFALAQRFSHVVASDNNTSSLHSAQRFLSSKYPPERISFNHCKGEDIASYHAKNSADLIAAPESIVLMDSRAALSSFAKVLKPGGTLAIWMYGRPHFSEVAYKERCQDIFDRIADLSFRKVLTNLNAETEASWKKTASEMASFLDYLDFGKPNENWQNVKRMKWNSRSAKLGFFGPGACDFEFEPMSNIRQGEALIEIEDGEMWGRNWNISGVREYIDYSFPGMKDLVHGDSKIEELLGELGEAMGGKNASRSYTWPIALVLASKV
ncbi:hypothetical protein HYFRA_00013701 [Hymenoscyphus fraxineus]|uniref:Methyltransferase domain-containing protein n=1 Tax=Hymenoscyphus fraxineus TaxID=746836 RepID=A0A9N9L7W7_9HELO|nr:hypothetical protein HYFRA_00013701 [Hymenoscyphus fraxineus]